MFEEYRNDPSSVSESWREFFADYVPGGVATVAVPAVAPRRPPTGRKIRGLRRLLAPPRPHWWLLRR